MQGLQEQDMGEPPLAIARKYETEFWHSSVDRETRETDDLASSSLAHVRSRDASRSIASALHPTDTVMAASAQIARMCQIRHHASQIHNLNLFCEMFLLTTVR